MRRVGQGLMLLGAAVGSCVAVASILHLGVANVPWLVNVALAKLGLASAAGLMATGAAATRLGNRRAEARRLAAPTKNRSLTTAQRDATSSCEPRGEHDQE